MDTPEVAKGEGLTVLEMVKVGTMVEATGERLSVRDTVMVPDPPVGVME